MFSTYSSEKKCVSFEEMCFGSFKQLYCVSGFWILSRVSKSMNSFSQKALATVMVWDYPRLSRKITILKTLPVVRLTLKFLAASLKRTTLVPTRKSIKHVISKEKKPCTPQTQLHTNAIHTPMLLFISVSVIWAP